MLGDTIIRHLAGPTYYERGVGYHDDGRVVSLVVDGGRAAATVLGTEPYRVRLEAAGDSPDDVAYECSCPLGAQGAFCKHCVAVALMWLDAGDGDGVASDGDGAASDGDGDRGARPSATASPVRTLDDVRAWLRSRDRDDLVDIIIDRALEDERLLDRLLLGATVAAAEGDGGVDASAFRAAIDRAADTGDFVAYGASFGWAARVDDALDAVEALLEDDHADAVIDLTEHALRALERAAGRIDDSAGLLGDLLDRAQAMHLAACERARPEPRALARRLFAWELNGEWDVFAEAAFVYADVLGAEGLAVYRELAEAEWADVPALGPGEDDPERWGRRFRVTNIMLALARVRGDVDEEVAVLERDLSTPYRFLCIAERCREAGEHDRALEWAERGIRAFDGPQRDDRLRAFLVEEYDRRGRHDDALALAWSSFDARPGAVAYRELRERAERANRWADDVRERALARLRDAADDGRAEAERWQRRSAPAVGELIRVLLQEEDDADAAWAEAERGGCPPELRLRLAERREAEHPEDALAVYREAVEWSLDRRNKEAYAEAVARLGRIRDVLAALGREDEFSDYLESVRGEHRRKRNFMKLLEKAAWSR